MDYKKINYLFLIVLLLIGCIISPKEIEYGKDACSFCKMMIVDTKFASEIVTNKGRAFKYDAIECMLYDIKEKREKNLAYILVTDYNEPKKLIDATKATFLINQNIKSPMGANLSAYISKEKGQLNGTELYDWNAIKAQFKN